MLPKGKCWTALGVIILVLVLLSPFLRVFADYYLFRWKMQNPDRARNVIAAARILEAQYAATGSQEPWDVPPDKCPPAIRDLAPSWVSVSSERVHVEMGGGNFHYGIDCFPEGIVGEGQKKILDGIWFVTE